MAYPYHETVVYGTDDDNSSYFEYDADILPPQPSRRSRSKTRIVHVRDQAPPRIVKPQPHHYHSYNDAGLEREPEVIIQNQLNVPAAARPRALSQGGSPAPNILYVQAPPREPSQTRIKNYRGKGKRHDDSDSSDSDRRRSRKIDADTAEKLARLRLLEEREQRRLEMERDKRMKDYIDPELAAKIARLKLLEEQGKKPSVSPEMAEQLARLKSIEQRNAREEEKHLWEARIRDEARRDEERQKRIALEYEEKLRRRQRDEEEAVNKAEAARARAQAEADATRDRLIAAEREKAASAAAKQKAETARILAEAKDKAAAEKAEKEMIMAEERLRMEREKRERAEERARIVSEERARAEKEKREREEERRRILAEEEERKKKEKEEWEETKARVLAEEKREKEKAEAKKKAEDDAFKLKVKEEFMAVGYSPDYIEAILDKKDRDRKASHSNSSSSKNNMALALARPTYIRVQLKHLLPETLNAYHLPWEYDPDSDKHILIKEYVDHDFQQILFQHTKKILKRRDELRIADGYTKETITTLKPNVLRVKDKDSEETYLVRRKSTGKSPSRPHRNWMFT